MQKLRRLKFFDCFYLGPPAATAGERDQGSAKHHPALKDVCVSCVAGNSKELWLGDAGGGLHRVDERLEVSSFQAFDITTYSVRCVGDTKFLVGIGRDEDVRGGTKYRVFSPNAPAQAAWAGSAERRSVPPCLREAKVFSGKIPEQTVTTFDCELSGLNAAEGLGSSGYQPQAQQGGGGGNGICQLAVGTDESGIMLFRGDLIKDRTCRLRLLQDMPGQVTSLHFCSFRGQTVLFATTPTSVAAYASPLRGDPISLFIEPGGGCPVNCSALVARQHLTALPTVDLDSEERAVYRGGGSGRAGGEADDPILLVMRSSGVFAFDAEQGNMSALPLDGETVAFAAMGGFFAVIKNEESVPSPVPSVPLLPGARQRQLVSVVLNWPEMRAVGHCAFVAGASHLAAGMGSFWLVHTEGGGTCVAELRQRDGTEILDTLVRKRAFDWAIEWAIRDGHPDEIIQELYRLYGDFLIEKGHFEAALDAYLQTAGAAEPSHVIDALLSHQQLHTLSRYLLRLHESGNAKTEHLQLLLRCFVKMKDLHSLETFLSSTAARASASSGTDQRGTQEGEGKTAQAVQLATAELSATIEQCRAAGYADVAARVALQHGHHEIYLGILCEDLREYGKAIEHLESLPDHEACGVLLGRRGIGRRLLSREGKRVVALMKRVVDRQGVEPQVFFALFASSDAAARRLLGSLMGWAFGRAEERGMRGWGSRSSLMLLELLLEEEGREGLEEQTDEEGDGNTVNGERNRELNGDNQQKESGLESLIGDTEGEGGKVKEGSKRADVIDKLLSLLSTTHEDSQSALALCQLFGFTKGILFLSERAGLHWHAIAHLQSKGDVRGEVEFAKKRAGAEGQVLVQTLARLRRTDGNSAEAMELLEALKNQRLVGGMDVLSLLGDEETGGAEKGGSAEASASSSSSSSSSSGVVSAPVGALKDLFRESFASLESSSQENRSRAARDVAEAVRMRKEARQAERESRVFQLGKCSQCGLQLETPVTHFFCMHSFHTFCLSDPNSCRRCAPDAQAKKTLREQRSVQALNADDFFKYLRGSTAGFPLVAEYFGREMFDMSWRYTEYICDGDDCIKIESTVEPVIRPCARTCARTYTTPCGRYETYYYTARGYPYCPPKYYIYDGPSPCGRYETYYYSSSGSGVPTYRLHRPHCSRLRMM
uniref:RING-type domain-containing protein n=1 Tax=Chromera velia CCMP2878 TaxID=1169474 RepID=A0A0G4G6F6_9ALVE|eukprot:Cvel_20478.t1-p1 / transcript=Cvel_20478.t1 / gene=Cvel_20478 / organism=Chromera_velia_CCMP2878 / gene_product=Vacuolar protein sorting-associated protein 11, putative / transcript_product=Vacuolar protein sorting-associated protein 11, putative / location=Cvel_scaffold1840:1553-15665(+) / protein_length=1166 / sequence_SO=supercontig / SO=protein_coding / is_pseudo=false